MNRINTATVYVVLIIWAGIVLLYSITGTGSKTTLAQDNIKNHISSTQNVSSALGFDHRLNALTPLYY